ncbi:MAG TPA: hypothetical protein VGY66_04780 [Gemmataceae bacterium]|jgi:hypothetical protein|nr:hypothetical protein [Gemmataceae bacterium]
MAQRKFKRLVLGDVVEIALPGGKFAYAQYVFNYTKPPVWGTLLRVLKGIYPRRQKDVAELVDGEDQFPVFYPAARTLSLGLITIIGNAPVPLRFKKLPLFRACNTNFKTGVKTWWLWDGKRERYVGKLSPEHYDLPICQIIGHQLLVDRIASGWSPRDEV